ncbi:Cdc2l1 protein [Coemansia reversa NRRL 1564]|uniref:cyclin-dependent kinase n=1 Tax=Coemansia reversa (strain ATCC 12441 / NRRL 1564) TaxID=763665 RepID=A0A2G5B9R9_COERN|nr:Cdc2l1 protein [Coemansia reversa NRRL 1564]|eukprot:PIA15766.1 Cdc2l1 protein [Coemansia reversa NRRL 1564]
MASPFQTLPTHLAQDFGHLSACRQIDLCYEKLNKIEEGTYGIVYRAKDISTGEIVALKHLKLDQERNGFPITSLREIHTLLLAKHPNIINVREIVVGKSLNSIYMVMDFMEHDLRTLMESMRESFRPSEVKSLLLQLCSAIAHLHGNWIVHRDLKTSNLLMASGGALRVADFGLARKYSSPLGHMTGLVVTLWYRAPELLMGEKQYSTAVDMWSVGCIFAELFVGQPLFQGRGEIDQITRIFAARGVPNKLTWPDFDLLPNAKVFKFSSSPDPSKLLRARMQGYDGMTENAYDLLTRMLALDPKRRISAHEALDHPYFTEHPPPKDPSMFPTWPTRSNNS